MTDDESDERYDPNRSDDQASDAPRGTDVGAPASNAPATQRAQSGRNAPAARTGGGTRYDESSLSSLPDDPRTLVYWGGLVICGLLAVVALISFYTSMLDVIRTWVDPEYRSLFRSAFSLVVLVGAVLGVSLTVRELGE